jgi:hypothetical protein
MRFDQIGGFTPDAYAEITRPTDTTAYTALDAIMDTTSIAAAVPLRFAACRQDNGSGVITGGRIVKSTDTTTALSLRLWLFAAQPFAAGAYPGDNAALSFTYASMARFVGFIDFATWIDAGTAAIAVGVGSRPTLPFSKRFVADKNDSTADRLAVKGLPDIPAARLIYGLLQDRGGYTPASGEQFRIWLDIQAD